MLSSALVALVLLQGNARVSALGPNAKTLVSRLHGMRMKAPAGWTIDVDGTKRPRKSKSEQQNSWNSQTVFELSRRAGDELTTFRLRVSPENQTYFNDLGNNPAMSRGILNGLPSTFPPDGGRYWETIEDRRTWIFFSTSEIGVQKVYRNWSAQALFSDALGNCHSFQLDYSEPVQSSGSGSVAAEKQLQNLYPMFVEMLRSIKFVP